MSDIIHAAFDGLRESPEPVAWSQGGPRNADWLFIYSLPIPNVDTGEVDVLNELENLITPQIEALVGDSNLHIASAFVNRETDAPQDAYVYTVTFSVYVA